MEKEMTIKKYMISMLVYIVVYLVLQTLFNKIGLPGTLSFLLAFMGGVYAQIKVQQKLL